jgi:4'-phosphopantetheinyl transferase
MNDALTHLLLIGRLDIDLVRPVPDQVLDRLSPARREKAVRMKVPAAAWRIAAGSLLVNEGVRLLDFEPQVLDYDERGKPVFKAGCGLEVSLSHAGRFVTALLSSAPCGVDVEKIRPLDVKAGRHIFSVQEMQCVASLSGDMQRQRFFEIWALKESLAKWQGTGISGTLREGTFTRSEDRWTLAHPAAQLDAQIIPVDPEYVVAALTAGPGLKQIRYDFDYQEDMLIIREPA